ncbi:hypothetical protein N8633_02715, partial [bacterium]|nr:hypothetical protein [bacterium]
MRVLTSTSALESSLQCFFITVIFISLFPLKTQAAKVAPSWGLPPHQQTEGVFWRTHWYERERTTPKIGYTRRARINAPEAVLDPRWGARKETRENGLTLIQMEENLFQIRAAELYAELWGGHPGTANKRVTINGRTNYQLPRSGTEAAHCAFTYPIVPLAPTDIVNGFNAVQWNVDEGSTFWGHALIDQACIRVALTNSHPELVTKQLNDLNLTVAARVTQQSETIRLSLSGTFPNPNPISEVIYQAWYRGYDDDGDQNREDWHGFTKDRQPVAFLGSSRNPPFRIKWDTSMIPAQKNVAVRAILSFKEIPDTVYLTRATPGLTIRDRKNVSVHLYSPVDLPASFWSRANQEKTCSFILDEAPASIERAELYVKSWAGGPGEIDDYFTLNGVHFPIAEGQGHAVQFSRLSVDPQILRQGRNTIRLLSDTEHHGIE